MGHDRHHAIIVTSPGYRHALKARKVAYRHNLSVSEIMEAPLNYWHTFLVGPDGSKEGWADSKDGDAGRAKFIEWLDKQRYSDGSSPFAWVEVQYGDHDSETKILNCSDEPKAADEPCNEQQ